MPREIIHNDEVLEGATNSSPLAIEVAWGRNTFVQLGSIDLRKEPYGDDRGYFIDLDRHHINRLIRVLRRARDQAYGADE